MSYEYVLERHAAIRNAKPWEKQPLRHRAAACWFPNEVIAPIGATSLMYMCPVHVCDLPRRNDDDSRPPNMWHIDRLDLLALTGEFFADTQEVVYQKVKAHNMWHRPEGRPGYQTLDLARDADWLEKAFFTWDDMFETLPNQPRSENLSTKFSTPTVLVGTFEKPELDLTVMIDAASEREAYAEFEKEIIPPRSKHNDTKLWLIPATWYKTIRQDAFLFEDFTGVVKFNADGTFTPIVYQVYVPIPRKEQLFKFGDGSGEIKTVLDCRPGQLKPKKNYVAPEKRPAKSKVKTKAKGVDPVSPYGRTEFPADVLADDHVELGLGMIAAAEQQAQDEYVDIGAALDALNAGLASR